MASLGPPVGAAALLLLGASDLALPPTQAADGSSLHSLGYFYTSVSEPGQGWPQFLVVGYVDDQPFYRYDSNSRRAQPRAPWMEKAGACYWDKETEIMQDTELVFRKNMTTLRNLYNQSEGFHTLQYMNGCELRKDGSKEGRMQYGYDGRDYLSFDKETLTWTAADGPAQITKREWDANSADNQDHKAYLEVECFWWLQRYLGYGKETLLRAEHPVGKVTHKALVDDWETLICEAYGFYPKEIEATWRKDGESMEHETFRTSIAPNSDGTYHIWLSIEIDPKERDLYRCHVDHDSLPEPLVLAFEKPDVKVKLIVGAIMGAVLLAGIAFFLKYCRERAQYAATSDERPSPSPIHDVRGREEEDTAPSHPETNESRRLHPYNYCPGREGREEGGDEAPPNLDPEAEERGFQLLLLQYQGRGVGQPQLHLPRPRSLPSISSAATLTME